MEKVDSFWREVVGQQRAVAQLEHVLSPEGASDLAHAWLITGPPGSGRSNIAYLFAAALLARDRSEREDVYRQVRSGIHPDLDVLKTDGVIIKIDDARQVALKAHYAPSVGRYRVILVEDADRLPEKSSNTLLKALEEPPERTIWILMAPSEADMLPTIRSRTRSLRLTTPKDEEVAALLETRDSVDPERALQAARLAQGHIGMARTLASDDAVLERRQRIIETVLSLRSLSRAMLAAGDVMALAKQDAEALTSDRDEAEKEEYRRILGLTPGQAVPLKLRGQLRALEEDQKRRARRGINDAVDRVLLDIMTAYRDMTYIALGAESDIINEEFHAEIAELAQKLDVAGVMRITEAVETARTRLQRGVTALLIIEALFGIIATTQSGS